MPTIAAIATARGAGGIGIVRLSGPGAGDILRSVFRPSAASFTDFRPWTLHRGTVADDDGPLDDALAVLMPGPRTFTGEDMAEIQCHGGAFLLQSVLEAVLRRGARPAERGEFSRRAFLNGRLDLSQAEAVAEMISAPSREALRHGLRRLEGELGRRVEALRSALLEARARMCLASDFPDDETEDPDPSKLEALIRRVDGEIGSLLAAGRRARLMREGAPVAIAGGVNTGKSSLMNALLGRSRALVTDIPGTTRDFLEEQLDMDGLPVRLTDTAGLREAGDEVERLGMELGRRKARESDAILLLLDGDALGSEGAAAPVCPDPAAREILEAADRPPVLLVWNKADLRRPAVNPPAWAGGLPCVVISARTGEGIDDLARSLRLLLLEDAGSQAETEVSPNTRQAGALERARGELGELLGDLRDGRDIDCLSVRLDVAAAHLADVVGLAPPEEILNRVFFSFCIGK